MIKAIFFDIDGTLVSFKTHSVPDETKKAVQTLRNKGIKVFIATGRMLNMIDVLGDMQFDGFIAYNGACCTDGEKNILYKHVIPQRELNNLVERLKSDKFPVSFMCKDNMYVNYHNNVVLNVAAHVNVDPPIVRNPSDIIKEDVYQLCIYVDECKLQQIIDETLPDCRGRRWIPDFADVNMKDIDKDSGMDRLIDFFDIKLSETMAFGDGGNDISMLKHAAIGIAMGNSSDEVKRSADYITDSVDDNGVVNALKHFNLL